VSISRAVNVKGKCEVIHVLIIANGDVSISIANYICHYRVGLCHHGMVRHQDADRGDGLQIWRIAANILNKQWWTADKGLSPILGVRLGFNSSSPRKDSFLRNVTQGLGIGRIFGTT